MIVVVYPSAKGLQLLMQKKSLDSVHGYKIFAPGIVDERPAQALGARNREPVF